MSGNGTSFPREAQTYVKRLESLMRVPITHIGIGESREDMIVLNADGE